MHRTHFYPSRRHLAPAPAPFRFTNSSNLCLRDVGKVCFVLQDFDGGICSIFDYINYGSKSFPQTVYFPVSSCLVFFANTKSFFSFFYAFLENEMTRISF